MPNKKSNISFRFNNSQGSIEEQIFLNQNDSSFDSINIQPHLQSTKLLQSEVVDKKFKTLETSERVKDFFTSKLIRGRNLDSTCLDDLPVSSSKWLNDSWKKFQNMIEERKEKAKKEKENQSFFKDKVLEEEKNKFEKLYEESTDNLDTQSSTLSSVSLNNESSDQSINSSENQFTARFKRSIPSTRNRSLDDQSAFKVSHSNVSIKSNQSEDLAAPTETLNDFSIRDLSFLWTNSYLFYFYSLIIPIIAIILGFKSPFPSFLNGFIFGIIISFSFLGLIIFIIIHKFFKPKTNKQTNQFPLSFAVSSTLSLIEPSSSTSLTSSSLTTSFKESSKDSLIYKCWFHLLSNQDLDNEHGSQAKHFKTELVFLRLQGTSLRLSKPKSSQISNRLLSENSYVNFIEDMHFDLINCKRIYLWFPSSVKNKKKYLWVKKYPIILEIDDCKNSSSHFHSHHSNCHHKNLTELILFGRTNRSKEEWYWRLRQAASDNLSFPLELNKQEIDDDLIDQLPSSSFSTSSSLMLSNSKLSLIASKYDELIDVILSQRSLYISSTLHNQDNNNNNLLWFNFLIGRVFFDFLTNKHWSSWVSKKIQRKLTRLDLPYFMQTLTIKDIDLGRFLPRFIAVEKPPEVNDKGIWIDFQIDYCGGFTMTLETKLNLMRLKDQGLSEKEMKPFSQNDSSIDSNQLDSDPESIISASDDEENSDSVDKQMEDSNSGKFIRIVDKIAASKYFQHATDNKYIKRAMEDISNTPLILRVFVQELSGVMSINLPPPPSDRIWYGFRDNPNLVLSARPQLGEHRVSLTPVIDWIEKKLIQEFHKLLVIPNMDDFVLQVMLASNCIDIK